MTASSTLVRSAAATRSSTALRLGSMPRPRQAAGSAMCLSSSPATHCWWAWICGGCEAWFVAPPPPPFFLPLFAPG